MYIRLARNSAKPPNFVTELTLIIKKRLELSLPGYLHTHGLINSAEDSTPELRRTDSMVGSLSVKPIPHPSAVTNVDPLSFHHAMDNNKTFLLYREG